MNNDLIERYLYAVTGRMPRKMRTDVEAELHSAIDDMLAARCEGPPTEEDIRAVLRELGPPNTLAEQYAPDVGKSLIGPPYFGTYKLVLRIVLACVLGGITISQIVLLFVGEAPATWWQMLGQWFFMLLAGVTQAFTFVTLSFAIMQWRSVPLEDAFKLDDLPAVPKEKERISIAECIVGIVRSVLLAVGFLLIPEIFGFYSTSFGAWVPLFSPTIIRAFWPLILFLSALGIGYQIFALYERRHTLRLAVVNMVVSLVSLGLLVFLFSSPNIINPHFLKVMQGVFPQDDGFLMGMFSNIQYILLGVIAFAYVLDIATSFWNARKYSR